MVSSFQHRLLRHGPPALLILALAAWQAAIGRPGVGAVILLAGGTTWAIVPGLGAMLRRRRIVVRPGGRSGHFGSIPLCGGIAVFVPFALTAWAFALAGDMKSLGLAFGATMMLIVGVLDDIKGVSPKMKIAAQLLAGAGLICTGYHMTPLGLPGVGTLHLGPAEIPLLLCWVVVATNAFNLIDGMDGLASGIGFIALVGLAYLGVHPIVSAVTAGALMGFLPFNLSRARIFLGDTGTMFLGFVLAALLLELPSRANVPLVAALYAYPLGDVALAVLRRFVRGKPLLRGDRSHIHHKLKEHWGGVRAAVGTVHVLAACAAIVGIWMADVRYLIGVIVGWGLLAFILVQLGRVRLRRMIGNRTPFQELHLLRRYVDGSIRLARDREGVKRALERLVTDMHLSEVRMGDITILNGGHGNPRCQVERVRLKKTRATWSYVASAFDEEEALQAERRTVVHEVLRSADSRLRELARSRGNGS